MVCLCFFESLLQQHLSTPLPQESLNSGKKGGAVSLSQPVTEIIKARTSWRSYAPDPMARETRAKLEAILAEDTAGPFGSAGRFQLVTASDEDRDALRGLGTYGFIKGATGFIVGAIKQGDRHLEDYGYLFERIILHCTDLGLGTCWMGGTFKKSNFEKKIDPGPDEIVPAVSPVGIPTPARSTRDRLIRRSAGSKTRLPWDHLFFNASFNTPLTETEAGDYAVPLEMVRIGPSASNKQPWRIVKEAGKGFYHFYLRRSPGYGKNMGKLGLVDLQRLDMGIAMCHFELSANEAGLTGKWTSQPPAHSLPEGTEYITSWIEE
jgi:nitroreductase